MHILKLKHGKKCIISLRSFLKLDGICKIKFWTLYFQQFFDLTLIYQNIRASLNCKIPLNLTKAGKIIINIYLINRKVKRVSSVLRHISKHIMTTPLVCHYFMRI